MDEQNGTQDAEPTQDQGAADSQQEPQQDSGLQTPQADQPVPTEEVRNNETTDEPTDEAA